MRLKIFSARTNVFIAFEAVSAEVLNKIKVILTLKGRTYNNLKLGVIPGLCADIVLGQTSTKQHDEVVFKSIELKDSL